MNTTSDEAIYYNDGIFVINFENPHPEWKLWKPLPCGHHGLWIIDRWVCQICWGYEKPVFLYQEEATAPRIKI